VVEDRCPHRRVPLTLGKIINGSIRCAYHGWTFDGASGSCVDVPNLGANERVSRTYCVKAYRVSEHQGFVCTWLGEGEPSLELPFQNSDFENAESVTSGSGTVALGYDNYLEVLLDGPQVLFEIPGVRFTDFFLGDAILSDGRIVLDREAEWGAASKPVAIKVTDRPLILRTELNTAGHEAIFRLLDDCENQLAMLLLSIAEGKRGTTRFCWRFYRYRSFKTAQPTKARLLSVGREAVIVRSAIDGSAISSLLVGPSFDCAALTATANGSSAFAEHGCN